MKVELRVGSAVASCETDHKPLDGQALFLKLLDVTVTQINRWLYEPREPVSLPMRNCDRFGGDPKMLHTAWWDWTGSPSGKDENGVARMTFGQWLLAPIEEGGAE